MKILKLIIETFSFLVGMVGRIIIPYKIAKFSDIFINKIYTYWISGQFNQFGEGSRVKWRIDLIGGKYISIYKNVKIGKRSTLAAWKKHGNSTYYPEIIFKNNVEIGDDAHISASNKIVLGHDVLIGKKVTIVDNSHGKNNLESLKLAPAKREIYSSGPIIIDNGVWIGDKVTILANVHIGENAIIGSNAVVTHDVPANCIFGGIPARLIKHIV